MALLPWVGLMLPVSRRRRLMLRSLGSSSNRLQVGFQPRFVWLQATKDCPMRHVGSSTRFVVSKRSNFIPRKLHMVQV